MKAKKQKTYKRKTWIERYALELVVLSLGLLGIHAFLLAPTFQGESIQAVSAGQFGDLVGGYIGTIFSLVSVVLLFATLRSQRQSSEKENFENRVFELVKLHRDNVQEIGIGDSFGKRIFVILLRELRLVFELTKPVVLSRSGFTNLDWINISYLAFFYGVGPNSSRILRDALRKYDPFLVDEIITMLENSEIRTKAKRARKLTFEPFEGHQSRLAHYFRHLYQAISFVHNSPVDVDKKEYSKLFRAQLTNHEQALLFFNSISDLGRPWRIEGLITNYEMIKNIPKNFIDEEEEIDVCTVYPKIKFEWMESPEI